MKVIAGLGNPGAQYANTPHSIGFEVVDAIAREIGAEWKASASFKGELATGMFAGQKVLLLKPMTYMNLSGDSVAPVVRYHNATPADLLVISDDIDLPVGRIRIRVGGSAGGHNGLKGIIERVGTPAFTRLRVGVGRDARDRAQVIGHVLGKFDPATRAVMDKVVPAAVQAAAAIISSTPQAAMNAWNGWSAAILSTMSSTSNK
jgi:PTH1 family peptidyl-tRNA hydrolase